MDTFKDHKLFFESLTLSNTTLEAKGSGVVEDLARIYRLVERTPLSAAPQPHHPLPHLDAIANNNGTTLPHQKSKHRPPTGIPKGKKKRPDQNGAWTYLVVWLVDPQIWQSGGCRTLFLIDGNFGV